LPEAAVKESKDRVRGAIINSHFEFPMQRITINLAPADVPKEAHQFLSARDYRQWQVT
jgi:magnesium chelatase family protein